MRRNYLPRSFRKTMSLLTAALFVLFCFVLFTSQAEAAQQGSLVGYWKLDESSGTSVADVSGNGHNGTLKNGPIFSSDIPSVMNNHFPDSHSLTFDGTDDSVGFGNVDGVGTSDFTLATWFKTSDTDAVPQTLIGKDGQGYLMNLDANGNLHFNLTDNATYVNASKGADYRDGTWHHAAITFDRDGNATFYIDGTAIGTSDISSQSGSLNDAGNPLSLGQNGNNMFFHGSLDDVRIYNRVLSANEIHDLANGENTSATWNGTATGGFSTAPSNWDIGTTPDAFTNIIVSSSSPLELIVNTGMANLTLEQGAILHLYGNNLTQNSGGTFSNNGDLYLVGSETLTNFTNDPDSGAVHYQNDNANTITGLAAGNTYNNIYFQGTGNTVTLNHDLTVNGNFQISTSSIMNFGSNTITVGGDFYIHGGTVNGGTSTIKVAGDWKNDSGGAVFVPGQSSVELNGAGQHITGNNTFYNLKKIPTVTDTLTIEAGSAETVQHALVLSAPLDKPLSIRSSVPGTQWSFDPEGDSVNNVFYALDVQDSNNTSGTTLNGTSITNSGNNTGWTFTTAAVSTPTTSNYTGYGELTAMSYLAPQIPTPTLSSPAVCNLGDRFNTQTGLPCVGSVSSSTPPVTPLVWIFTKDLQVGMTDSDIATLQQYLNSHDYPVALAGAGSVGNETTYFGTLTKTALTAFQAAHDIHPSAGYFGPHTRAYISSH